MVTKDEIRWKKKREIRIDLRPMKGARKAMARFTWGRSKRRVWGEKINKGKNVDPLLQECAAVTRRIKREAECWS